MRVHVLRVFCREDGTGGNEVGVQLDGEPREAEARQRLAAELGFAETVWVDDPAEGRVRIFTPAVEFGFAGHPLVGVAWLLAQERGEPVPVLRPPAGEVMTSVRGDSAYVVGRPEWAPPFEHVQLGSPEEVREVSYASGPNAGYWAWEDEAAGVLYCRVFLPEAGVPEDEATGAHAMRLAATLGRELTVQQGRGSIILAAPAGDGLVVIGGRVAFEELREI